MNYAFQFMGQTLQFHNITTGGPRIRYAEQGSPGQETLILLHGYTDCWFSFSRVLPLLPAAWHVIAPDMRGHGGSEQTSEGYEMDSLAADVLRVLDHAGIAEATIVGHCMGSFVARRVAALHPSRVRRLILAASAPTPRNAVLVEFAGEVQSLREPISRAFVRDFQSSTVHGTVPPEFLDQVIAHSFAVPVFVWKRALAGLMGYDGRKDLAAIRCPTLIFCGEHDNVFALREHLELVEAIGQSRLEVNASVGHSWHWEAPDDFVRRMIAWMSGAAHATTA